MAPDRLEVLCLAADRGRILLTAQTCGETARRPVCGRPSSCVHSHYRRTLADVPWQGLPARVVLWSRRRDASDCPRHIFTERLPGVAAPQARRTDRLRDWLLRVAFALGGAPGARLPHQLGVTVCGATLLAQLRLLEHPAHPTPQVLMANCPNLSTLVHEVVITLPEVVNSYPGNSDLTRTLMLMIRPRARAMGGAVRSLRHPMGFKIMGN